MANKALALKEEGNKRFQAGDYKGAESLYTQAITIDPSNSTFYTNRALVRVRQQSWDAVISDCLESIRLKPDNMKAYYYLAQAQIELNHPNEALTSALTAYEFCLRQGDASASNISALILRAKKEKWEHRERERVRRHNYLLKELEDALQTARKHDCEEINDAVDSGEMSYAAAREELEIVDEMTRQKIEDTRSFFAQCDPQTKLREVPEWLIDNITFSVMHDPVVKACSDFLEKNGWAVDW
ncbi:MAG: hypothetical protein M1823_004501 [Watsoniomyces obsoletus]|nr:MAG: hypothetical protein M1823_004501 [Watsoniomyces obsoletus]